MRHYKGVWHCLIYKYRTSTQFSKVSFGIKERIKKEVGRFKKFQQFVLGKKEKVVIANIDIRNYAKYVLRESGDIEKRELMGCLNRKIKLTNKIITFTN